MQRTKVRASIVGAGILAAWVVMPGALGALAARLGAWTIAMGLWLPWTMFIFPHDSVWLRSGTGGQRAWPQSVAIMLAVAQWSMVALVFGWKTRADSARERFWFAPVVVVAMAVVIRLGLHLSGYSVEVDGP